MSDILNVDVVAYTFKSQYTEFEATLVCIVSSRTARAT